MKKLVLITSFLFFFKGYSQENIVFQIKGGVNLSEIRAEEFQKNQGRTGYHFGAFINFPLSNYISLETGLGYTSQGGKAEFSTDMGMTRSNMELDYLQLPLMLTIKMFPKLSLSAGTSLNSLVHEEINFEYMDYFDLYSFLPTTREPISYETKSFEVHATLGLKYELFPRFFLHTTFAQGLTSAVEINDSSVKVKNRTYQFGIVYQF